MEILSKAKLTLFTALHRKKFRQKNRLFMVEGWKMHEEACLSGWPVEACILHEMAKPPIDLQGPIYQAPAKWFKQLSSQTQPEGIITVLHWPADKLIQLEEGIDLPSGPGFLLDRIQDPGNLGTILRTAAWFGFKEVICGPGCVDPLNPKVIRASMGAIFHLPITLLPDWSYIHESDWQKVYLAHMEGRPLHQCALDADSWILLGNEANGISESLQEKQSKQTLFIPKMGAGESLNVAMAAGIIAWKIRFG